MANITWENRDRFIIPKTDSEVYGSFAGEGVVVLIEGSENLPCREVKIVESVPDDASLLRYTDKIPKDVLLALKAVDELAKHINKVA